MNILVTGGAGYIGSGCAQMLLEAGHAVTVFDALLTGHRAAVPAGAKFIQANLADREALRAALMEGKFDAVMHFAAFIEAGESMRDPGKYMHNNVTCSIALLEEVQRAGIRRFVFSSSAAVYASSDKPLTEDSPIKPSNVYGQTKLMVEQTLEWYHLVHGLRYAALRYFNAAGALPGRGEDHPAESHLIPLVLRVPLGLLPAAKIFGDDYPTPDGSAIRDYIHVADLISAHLQTLDALAEKPRLVYNLGNGAGYSVKQVIEVAREVIGHPIPAEVTPRRAGDAARLVASSEKIRRELGWAPRVPALRDIIDSAWQWHRSHPRGYDDR
ncbi:MAG: UDP-glucose 4-epimerase GalE [Anaerolineales bacterium]|nr:UDP-glucose 4-epimerase GalE [Anaerolineales bacterium]